MSSGKKIYVSNTFSTYGYYFGCDGTLKILEERQPGDWLYSEKVIYTRGSGTFIFTSGCVIYTLCTDEMLLVKKFEAIHKELHTNIHTRNRTILHLTFSTDDSFELIPTTDKVAYEMLNQFTNHKLLF